MSGYLERLEALLKREPGIFGIKEERDLRAALDELKQARAALDAIALVATALDYTAWLTDPANASRVAVTLGRAITYHARQADPQQAARGGTTCAFPGCGHPDHQPEDGAATKFAADMERLRKSDPSGAQWVEHILAARAEPQPESNPDDES